MTQTKAELLETKHQGDIRLGDANSSHYVGFKAPATVSSSLVWTLPAADGSANQFLKTNASGVLSWGTVDTSTLMPLGGGTFTGNVTYNDNLEARFGTGADFKIYHRSSDESAVIKNANDTGFLRILSGDTDSSGILIKNANDDVTYLRAKNHDGVELFFNDVKKFETTSSGAKVTGELQMGGTAGVKFSHSSQSSIYESQTAGDELLFKTTPSGGSSTTALTISSTQVATFAGNAIVTGDLTVNGTTTTINTQTLDVEDKNVVIGKVSSPSDTTADGGGWTLKGASDKTFNWVNATDAWTSSEHIHILDTKKLILGGVSGTTDGLEIYHSSAHSFITNSGTGNLYIKDAGFIRMQTDNFVLQSGDANYTLLSAINGGACELYHNNSKKLETTSGGATITGVCTATSFSGSGANLTNLPPSGGSVQVVASGSLTANTAVMVKSDGTVEAVATVSETQSSGAQQSTYAADGVRGAYNPATGKVIMVWSGVSGSKGYSRVGTVSGTSISFGSAVQFQPNGEVRDADVAFHPPTGKVIVCYRAYWYSGQPGWAQVGTISGNSVTWGAETQYKADYAQENHIWYDPAASGYMHVAFKASGGGRYASFLISTSNNTCSCVTGNNNAVTFTSDGARNPEVCVHGKGGVLFSWSAQNNSYTAYTRGAVWNSSNTDYDFASAQGGMDSSAVYFSVAYSDKDEKFLCTYIQSSAGDTVGCKIGTPSGSGTSLQISWGSQLGGSSNIMSSAQSYNSLQYDNGSGKFLIATVGNNTARHRTLQINGSSLTKGTETTAFTGYGSSPSTNYSSIFHSRSTSTTNDSASDGKYIVGFVWYYSGSTYRQPMYFIKQMAGTTLDADRYLGIASAGYSNGQTATINVVGGTATGSSLTPNTNYYVQDNGSIGSTETSIKIGKAYTSTKILITTT